MKNIFIPFLLISGLVFSQEKNSLKLGVFGSLDANVAVDLGQIIRRNNTANEYEKSQLPPGKFNYGFTAQAGIQPLNWFAISGGIRYSYIDPNYHILYATAQPYFILNNPEDREYTYLSVNYGAKINNMVAKNANVFGVGFGKIEPISKRLGHKMQIYIEDQIIDGEGNFFVGLSYGIVIFSNKNL